MRLLLAKARAAFSDTDSLRTRAVSGALYMLAGRGYTQILRLAANLIMTRLLFPSAFGLMLIVNLVVSAVNMLSNAGVRGAVISKQEELDDNFLDTAWTILATRGTVLSIIMVLLAYPISAYYHEKILFGLLLVTSLVPLLDGLTSAHAIVQQKRVRLARVVIWQSLAPTASLTLTIIWLALYPTVWALAANGVIAAAIRSATSYVFFPARLPKLQLQRDAAREILRFGRWVFIATALTFLAGRGDSLVMSRWLTVAQLGVFGIAFALAKLVENVLGDIAQMLLFPVYSELRSGAAGRFHKQLGKIKLAMLAVCIPPVLLFSTLGEALIHILYDSRYREAGWMLEIMALGSVFYATRVAVSNIPLAFGDSYRHMWLQFANVILLLTAMIAGGYVAGVLGLVVGIVVGQALYCPVLFAAVRKYGVDNFATEAAFIIVMLSIVFSVWLFRGWPTPDPHFFG